MRANKSLLRGCTLVASALLNIYGVSAQESEAASLWKPTYSVLLQSEQHFSEDNKLANRLSGMSYLDAKISNHYLTAGIRAEYMPHPLPGLDATAGKGISHLYLRGRYKMFDVTLGDLYQQFGSGLLLRTYEDRPLGIDNAIRGGRLIFSPLEGLRLVALGGQQRNHFDRGARVFTDERGYIWGTDLQMELQSWLNPLADRDIRLELGGSFVSKYEGEGQDIVKHPNDNNLKLKFPTQVPGWALRSTFQRGSLELYGEYGYKWSDPRKLNGYTFREGSVAMFTATYSTKKLSGMIGLRRSENFEFRSDRTAELTDLHINHLLPFTQPQTYTLAALRPYATQPMGEWALQGELSYNIARGTALGGKYGTKIKLTASYISGLKTNPNSPADAATIGGDGVQTNFWGWGDKYFHDFGIDISRKVSKSYSFNFSYLNQYYDEHFIENHGEQGGIRSHIFIYDGKHKISRSLGLRTELQYLHTKQAEGDWLYGMAEFSIGKHLIVSVSDQYNAGETKEHYPMLAVAGTYAAHRLQLSYGRTRAGINCSAGVCRYMPETKGLYLSLNLAF